MASLRGTPTAKGIMINRKNGQRKEFGFNPESVSFKTGAAWVQHAIAGVHDPRLQYGGGEGTTIEFELHLIARGTGPQDLGSSDDVDADVRWYESLTFPDVASSSIANREPPRVTLLLGEARGAMPCVVTSVSTEHRLYYADLRTRYALLSVSLIMDKVVPRGYTNPWS